MNCDFDPQCSCDSGCDGCDGCDGNCDSDDCVGCQSSSSSMSSSSCNVARRAPGQRALVAGLWALFPLAVIEILRRRDRRRGRP
jgi:hypothetical protein